MSNAPSFLLSKAQASSPQGQSGTISKIEPQGVILNLGSGRVEVPLAQLQVDGRPAQVQDLRVSQVCVQEGGVWKVQPSPAPPMKPAFAPQSVPKAGPGLTPGPNMTKPGLSQKQGMGMVPPGRMNPPIAPPNQGFSPSSPNLGQPKSGFPSNSAPHAPFQSPPSKTGMKQGPGGFGKTGMNSAAQKPGIGVAYTVMKIDGENVQIKLQSSVSYLSRNCFSNPDQLHSGCSVQTDDGTWWAVVRWAVVQPVTAPSPAFQPAPVQPSGPRQQGSGIFKITKVQPTVVAAQEDRFAAVDVPVTSIFTSDGQSVTARQLKVNYSMQFTTNGTFVLLTAVQPDQQTIQQVATSPVVSFCLPISALDVIFSGQETPSFQALKDYAANKYAELYFNRNGSHVRSVACYLVQCALFEHICYQQQGGQVATPIIGAFGLQGLNGDISLKNPAFEEVLAGPIQMVEARIQNVLTGQHDLDFYQVAEQLQICLTVLRPNNTQKFDQFTFFPPSSTVESKWQHLVLVGQPPYPVLLQKKLMPLLAKDATSSINFKHYIYKGLKTTPPKIDPALVQQLKQVTATDGELKPMAFSLLRFSSGMLGRFNELAKDSLSSYRSSKVGETLRSLYQHAKDLSETYQDGQLNQEVAGLAQNIEGQVWDLFTKPCVCGKGFMDIALECGHGLCKQELNKQIMQLRQMGGRLVSKADGTTKIACPIDSRPVTLATLKTFSESLVQELMKQDDDLSGLVKCGTCQKACSAKILATSLCGHSMCGFCLNSPIPVCKACNMRQDNMLAALNNWVIQCDACGNGFEWKMLNPGSCGREHVLCPACCFTAVRSQTCAVRGCTELAADGIALMKAKAMGTCQICGVPKMISSLMELPCPCVICEKCAISKVKETTNYSFCWLCNTPFSQTLSESLYNKAGLSAAQPCIFCGGYLAEGGMKLECGDYTHPQCLYDWANQCLFSKPPQRVVCPCGIEVYADNFMEWFDNRKLQQVPSELALFFQQNPWEYEINCPRCGPESEALQISRKLDGVQPFTCSQCGYIFCVLCLESATDQFHAQGTCKYLVARSQIKEWESAKQPAVQCPHCLLVQGKGTGGQECQFCKHCFCAECVMDGLVINSHGGSYHREDCPYFNPNDLKSGAFCQDCPSCHVAGGDDACPQPKPLARKGQFAPWEKPKTAGEVIPGK